jgi:hypothetical protein
MEVDVHSARRAAAPDLRTSRRLVRPARIVFVLALVLAPRSTLAQEPDPATTQPQVRPNLGIQEDRHFWHVGAGVLHQPLPSGTKSLPRFDFGLLHVNESVAQLFQEKLGLSSDSQVADISYAIGFGRRMGTWHIGFGFDLGYAHFYEQQHIHGLHYAMGPLLNVGFPYWWSSLRFHLAGGWAGIAVSNVEFPGARALGGAFGEAGVGLSLE